MKGERGKVRGAATLCVIESEAKQPNLNYHLIRKTRLQKSVTFADQKIPVRFWVLFFWWDCCFYFPNLFYFIFDNYKIFLCYFRKKINNCALYQN